MKISHLIFLLVIATTIQAQNNQTEKTNNITTSTNHLIERYKVDYEVAGLTSFTDFDTINLNIDQYDYLRKEYDDVVKIDGLTGYHLILYSWTKVAERKLEYLTRKINAEENQSLNSNTF